jgi:NAD(P)-dependent dehydrogenase (short-subunit alcohol dehydrogenase family)
MKDLGGRVALITGAGSGIGRGAALAFANAGMHVLVADVDGQRAESVAAEVAARGRQSSAIAFDVRRLEGFQAAHDRALERFGRIDLVMNNVGVIARGRPEEIPLQEWERVIDTNFMSAVRSNSVFLPTLLAQGEGHVVNTASTIALWAYAYDRLPYTASKGALIAMSEGLALYLRPRGVGITCVCPGAVATNIREQMTVFGDAPASRRSNTRVLDPLDVGELIVAAVSNDQFLLLTHPEVRATLRAKADDIEAFVTARTAEMDPVS